MKARPIPSDNGFRFDDNQNIAPCRPITAEKIPEYPIPASQPRASMFSLEYTQLLTESKDLQAQTVTGEDVKQIDTLAASAKITHRAGVSPPA